MTRKVITTEDGTSSIWWEEMDEYYHSIYGALQESQHVFIEAGLIPILEQHQDNTQPLHILEMGFGTGLNALLTLQYCQQQAPQQVIHYTSLEAYPVEQEMVAALNFPALLGSPTIFQKMHQAAWNEQVSITPQFVLEKQHIQIQDFSPVPQAYQLLYFDAFAPTSQPELWTQEIFEKMYLALQTNACFTTYCAKGVVKRAIKAAGFDLEPLPGPKNKREMTRAWKR